MLRLKCMFVTVEIYNVPLVALIAALMVKCVLLFVASQCLLRLRCVFVTAEI